MHTISFQSELRPELPVVDGPKEYREQRALFLRLDELLGLSGIEADFFRFSMMHRKIDLNQRTALEVESLSRGCVLALRSNLARMITGMVHRDFCIRLADSPLLQWFLQIGRVDGVTAFAKSTSDRFAHCIDANSINKINAKIIRLLQSDSDVDWGLDQGHFIWKSYKSPKLVGLELKIKGSIPSRRAAANFIATASV
jgi:hypothetical protein